MCLSNIPVSLVSSNEWSSQITFQMGTELDPSKCARNTVKDGVCSSHGPWDLRAPVCMKYSKNDAVYWTVKSVLF